MTIEPADPIRPTGDQMLARYQAEQKPERARLRIYMGMAPGVGKTYKMLEEAHRRHDRGTDVVVGFVETYGRRNTAAQLDGLEIVPRRRVEYRGVAVEEMDADAIIARHPAVALIDELAHTNVPGSAREKRWQDVELIRDACIEVISTCNVQHVASIADAVETILGVPVHERIPDEVVRAADEIELVDMSPHALRQRMRHGNVYPAVVTGVAQVVFPRQANGSMITVDGATVGSSLIGQAFDEPKYFSGRPSAAGAGYDPTLSGGSNLAPTSQTLITDITQRVAALHAANGDAPIPVDLVTASASGLDPDISPAAAEYQVARVAKARGMTEDAVRAVVARHTSGAFLGFIGEPTVNVLELNLDLDGLLK